MHEESLFAAASSLPPGAERDELLERECAGNPALRDRLRQLLAGNDAGTGVLDRPGPVEPTVLRQSDQDDDPAGPRVGDLIARRYKLLEQIGEGGMGTVWVAEQIEPVRRKVALKLIKAGMDSRSVLARFNAERQALAVMDHPHIAKVLDGGMTEQGRPYFAMEYVKGVPLTQYCDEARLTIEERVQLFIPVCHAVQHAHQKGIIHRDLKPSNILVCLYDGQPVPKVIDFGLAKAMHQPLTEHTVYTSHGMMLGTPLYMSPEQAELNNLDVDTRTDIYALGVVLYELLTGSTPLEKQQFQQAAWQEVVRLIKEVEPPRPSLRLSGSGSLPSVAAQRRVEPLRLSRLLQRDLDWIVMKALEKDRGRRYDTANGFASDLQRYLCGEAVTAVPPSMGYRFRKFVRKHGVVLGTATAFALVLIGATAVSTWQAIRATQAERTARDAQADAEQAATEASKARVAERQAQEAAMTHVLRLNVSPLFAGATSAGWTGDDDDVSRDPDTHQYILKLAQQIPVIPDHAASFREAATLMVLWYGQYFAPLWPQPEFRGFPLHWHPELASRVSPDGRFLVGLSPDGSLQVYTFPALKHCGTATTGFRANWTGYRSYETPLDSWGFVGSDAIWSVNHADRGVCVWSLPDCRLAGSLVSLDYEVSRVLFSPDAAHGVVIGNANEEGGHPTELWEVASGRRSRLDGDRAGAVRDVALSPDGEWLAVLDQGGSVSGQSLRTGAQLGPLSAPADSAGVAFSPKGSVLVVGSPHTVRWFRTGSWQSAGPDGVNPAAAGEESIGESSLRAFSEDIVGFDFSRAFRRGQSAPLNLTPYAVHDDLILTQECDVVRVTTGERIVPPTGRRFPDEARPFATAQRLLVAQNRIIELPTELEVGAEYRSFEPVSYGRDGVGWFEWSNYSGGGLKDLQAFPLEPSAIDPVVLELWLKVVLRGELNEKGEFQPWDEATWEPHREVLSRHSLRRGEFAFPGTLATDPNYWLREEVDSAKNLTDQTEAQRQRWLLLADRLIGTEPTWTAYNERAKMYRALQRPLEALRDELAAARLGGDYYWLICVPSDAAALELANSKGRPAADYELALEWWRERARAIPVSADEALLPLVLLKRLGRESEQITDLQAALKLVRAVAEADGGGSWDWYRLTQLDLWAGDRGQFRSDLAAMKRRFGEGANSEDVARIVYACVHVPDALAAPDEWLELGRRAAQNSEFDRVLGACLVRAGDDHAAIPLLERGQGRAWDHLFLALAHHHLGNGDKAREYFERAVGQIENDDYPWDENIANEMLRDEVGILLNP
jgi:tetratricopeptide (TPR) repeat protein